MYVEIPKKTVIIMENKYQILFYVLILLMHLSYAYVNTYIHVLSIIKSTFVKKNIVTTYVKLPTYI